MGPRNCFNRTIYLKFNLLFLLFFCLSCRGQIDSPNSKFIDNIENLGDSLILVGFFSDCGEWGGHTESIYLYKKDSVLWFTYKQDSIRCIRIVPPEQKKLLQVSMVLNSKQREIILSYINNFIKFKKSFKEEGPQTISNGPNCYYLKTQDSSIEVCDHQQNWGLFEKMVISLMK